jgi:hypothetical protein
MYAAHFTGCDTPVRALKASQSACPTPNADRHVVWWHAVWWHAVCCLFAANIKVGQQRQGEAMSKVRYAEWLVLAAIVASAAAVQVRERLAGPLIKRHVELDQRPADCGTARAGVIAAGCGTEQDTHSEAGRVAPQSADPRAMSRRFTHRYAPPQNLWV